MRRSEVYADVAVDFANADRMRTYSYEIGGGDTAEAGVGDLVWVPFGYRPVQGIVMAVAEESVVENPRPIDSVVAGGPFLSERQVELVRWIATYYRTSLFRSAEVMLPPGTASRLRIWISRTPKASEGERLLSSLRLTDAQVEVMDLVPTEGSIRRDRLVKTPTAPRNRVLESLVREGYLFAESRWDRPTGKPRLVRHIRLNRSLDVGQVVDDYRRRRATRRIELARVLAETEELVKRSDATRVFGSGVVKSVIDDGVAEEFVVPVDRDPLSDYSAQESIRHELTKDQTQCVGAIGDAINRESQRASGDSSARFLLHGVTGSGKTEVYLRAVEDCLSAGKRAIVMVPEIAMTPQMLQRFAGRFPGRIALQHSGLTQGQRYDQWHKIRAGGYDIVLGSRSSIFAPVDRLGLVVIDEEHEWTFKQSDRAPRYHARDVAERLCEISGAVLVVGSATPDLTTFHRSANAGSDADRPYTRLELPYRINELPTGPPNGPFGRAVSPESSGGHPGTDMSIVDMRQELAAGNRELISRKLLSEMRENTEQGMKTILFINRRGSASFLQCVTCGTIRKCPNCNTSLTLHRRRTTGGRSRLQCHYCSYSVGATRGCRACSGTGVSRTATGTEGAEDAVKAFFPNTPVIRWDSDTAKNARDHTKILERFQEDGPQILIGTQMVAKGLDIPSVGLVGVLAADISLAIPSYRSPERTFQLIAQVVGRAGRSDIPGKAVIQTFLPDHSAIVRGATQDYHGFYEWESTVRRNSGLPPFVRHTKLTCASFEEAESQAEARSVVTRLRDWMVANDDDSITIYGPTPAFPFRRGGRFRHHIFLSTPAGPSASFNPILDAVELGTSWIVEIDPLDIG